MSGRVVTTSSPLMMRIRSAMHYHCAITGPMSSLDLAALLRVKESMTYKYLRSLEQEGLVHVAAWRLEDSLTRFQDVPEFMPGPGPGRRAPKSCRSRRDTETRKPIVIESAGEIYGYTPIDPITAVMAGIKQQGVSA